MDALDPAHVGARQAITPAPDQRCERVFGRARKKVRPAKKMNSKRPQENVALALAATVDAEFSAHWVIHENIMTLGPVTDSHGLAVLHGALPPERHACRMRNHHSFGGWLGIDG